jgi:nucleotide-binding universal stress UspA family protein
VDHLPQSPIPVIHRPDACSRGHRLGSRTPAEVVKSIRRREAGTFEVEHQVLEVCCRVCGETARGEDPTASQLPGPLDLAGMLTSEPEPYDWVLPGLPRGKAGFLVAPGGTGKSKLLWQIGVGIATGRDLIWPEAETRDPARVLFLSAEDDARDIHHRLVSIAAAFDLSPTESADLVANLDARVVPGWHMAEGLERGALAHALLGQLKPGDYRLIVADPLARLARIDENDQKEATTLVEVVEELAAEADAAFVVSHHVSKAAMRGDALDEAHAARGATALTDGFRWQSNLGRMSPTVADGFGFDDDERRRWVKLAFPKTNYSPPVPHHWLRFQPGGALQAAVPGGGALPTNVTGASQGGGRRGSAASPF